MNEQKGEIVIYQNDENNVSVNVKLEDENVWLTQQQMSLLFQTSRTNVIEHIKHIYEEGELSENSTCRNFRQVQIEGNREVERELPFYNLDLIISLGYRIKSRIATQFRIWATDKILSSAGETALQNAGSVSHEEAVNKALAEYKKYQVKVLSPVEKDYLNTIKRLEKKIGKTDSNKR
jgi:hypothetical protein